MVLNQLRFQEVPPPDRCLRAIVRREHRIRRFRRRVVRADEMVETVDILVMGVAAAMAALGAEVQRGEGDLWRVWGRGIGGLVEPDRVRPTVLLRALQIAGPGQVVQ